MKRWRWRMRWVRRLMSWWRYLGWASLFAAGWAWADRRAWALAVVSWVLGAAGFVLIVIEIKLGKRNKGKC